MASNSEREEKELVAKASQKGSLTAEDHKDVAKYLNESLNPEDMVIVSCREPKCVAEALTQLATQKGLSRSKLLSQLIHESIQNSTDVPLLQYAWRRDSDIALRLKQITLSMRGISCVLDTLDKNQPKGIVQIVREKTHEIAEQYSLGLQYLEEKINARSCELRSAMFRHSLTTQIVFAVVVMLIFLFVGFGGQTSTQLPSFLK